MIDCFTMTTAARVDDAFVQMLQVRHKLFIEQEKYRAPSSNGLELDGYDTPDAVYFVDRNARQEVVGVLRVSPTSVPYMIRDNWPDLIAGPLPESDKVWEASRIGVTTGKDERRSVVHRLLVAQLELALHRGIEAFIGVMPPKLWDRVYRQSGWTFHELGPVFQIKGYRYPTVTAELPVSLEVERAVRSATGLSGTVLRIA